MLQNDAESELHFVLCNALERVINGLATLDDVRTLCYGCGISPADVGLPLKHPVRNALASNYELDIPF